MKLFLLFLLLALPVYSQADSTISYFENGKIESIIHYNGDVRDGLAKFYYENGNLKEERNYVNGRVEGLVKIYNETGMLKEMFNIENGKRQGPTSYFDENGVFVKDIMFEDGKILVDNKPIFDDNVDNVTTENKTPGEEEKTKKVAKVSDDGVILPPPPMEEKQEDDPAYYLTAEIMPEPVGGMKRIQRKIIYPKEAKEEGIEGTVKIRAFINENGDVTQADVVEGIGYGCDEAARLAVFYAKFKPGLMRGKPIKIQMIIPVEFKLDK